MAVAGETDEFEQLVDSVASREPIELAQAVGDVLVDCHRWEELPVLEHEPELPLVDLRVRDLFVAPEDAPRDQRLQADHGSQQRRLAAARCAQERENLTLRHLEGSIVHGDLFAVLDGHVLDTKSCHVCTSLGRTRSAAIITAAVITANTTEAASAVTWLSPVGRLNSR